MYINHPDRFVNRHLGLNKKDQEKALATIGVATIDELIEQTIPNNIRMDGELKIDPALSEAELLAHLLSLSKQNKVLNSYIGLGYYGTFTPSVIRRNIFENPGWYTQYTPYQAEIAQGRLEALLNFQTMVADLTAFPMANASLLDEATAAAEAMIMLFNQSHKKNRKKPKFTFLVEECIFPQTKSVIELRATPLDIKVEYFKTEADIDFSREDVFAIFLQYPNKEGAIINHQALTEKAHEAKMYVAVAADLMALTVLKAPGEWGADVAVGNTQRFGVPMGYGGPHAAYFATKEEFTRGIPGRLIGISKDRNGDTALRMALQTREQHIRRGKATSNICTAQALLAIMAGMYAVYHGPKQLKAIATRINMFANLLADRLSNKGFAIKHQYYFDTICIDVRQQAEDFAIKLKQYAELSNCNFWIEDNVVQISLDETTNLKNLQQIEQIFDQASSNEVSEINYNGELNNLKTNLPEALIRSSEYLTHPVFNTHHSETQMMRYIKSLELKDLSLTQSMIPLGSCTMKLNAATQLIPLSFSGFAHIHPFVPIAQAQGYQAIIAELEKDLSEITGMAACSLQPNSGAQGEYAGLMTIRAYHLNNGDAQRKKVLIPSSAHGTNPASAVMAGMEVVVIKCDDYGNIDFEDIKTKAELHKEELAGLMITYPSTHGVFEDKVKEICKLIHDNGGLVYLDGANMNAQVGLTNPGIIGGDVVHLNLHKTFAIPHGGGGPGMGPICVNEKLKPFLPKHAIIETGGEKGIDAVSAAPYGSASILIISYAYIKLLGAKGLKKSTEVAILNANYIKARLENDYEVLFVGKEYGRVAHELIIDLRPFKELDVDAEDVAKRLIDYSFHAPTMSWPVPGTIMIEPTESEDLAEIDRFCNAMLAIRNEIKEIENGEADKEQNVLNNAPHTMTSITADDWNLPYKRSKAAYPVNSLHQNKFWASVARIDNTFGDKNLICTCPPIEAYAAVK